MYFETLSGGDVTKWKELEELDISTAFAKLLIEKEKGEYKRRLQSIHDRKARKKKS